MNIFKKKEPQFLDFIGMVPECFPKKLCKKLVDTHKDLQQLNKTVPGRVSSGVIRAAKDSTDVDLGVYHIYRDLLHETNSYLQESYNLYMEKYWQIQHYLDSHIVTAWQIQRYDAKDNGGYHQFHIENSGTNSMRRVMAYIVYLNDIDEGGETEFLHQNIRVKPEAGKVVIFPAYFTHVHRGNPVLSGQDKYIMTGWFEYA
jgi:hypothetical protein